jgi:hypothetical protein
MFRVKCIELLKMTQKLFCHPATSEQRYRTFEKWVLREISLRIFRLSVEKTKHPGRTSHPDVTSGPGVTSGPDRMPHPVISRVYMGIYGHIFILCVAVYPMCAYMGPNFANHSLEDALLLERQDILSLEQQDILMMAFCRWL